MRGVWLSHLEGGRASEKVGEKRRRRAGAYKKRKEKQERNQGEIA